MGLSSMNWETLSTKHYNGIIWYAICFDLLYSVVFNMVLINNNNKHINIIDWNDKFLSKDCKNVVWSSIRGQIQAQRTSKQHEN